MAKILQGSSSGSRTNGALDANPKDVRVTPLGLFFRIDEIPRPHGLGYDVLRRWRLLSVASVLWLRVNATSFALAHPAGVCFGLGSGLWPERPTATSSCLPAAAPRFRNQEGPTGRYLKAQAVRPGYIAYRMQRAEGLITRAEKEPVRYSQGEHPFHGGDPQEMVSGWSHFLGCAGNQNLIRRCGPSQRNVSLP